MSWFLSMVTTRRCCVISFTVWVLGTSTSMPDWRMGAVIMKMISRTRTTSMNGTMLISESAVWVDLFSWGIDALPEIVAGVDGYQISASSDQEAKKKGANRCPNGIDNGSCYLLSARCYPASTSK